MVTDIPRADAPTNERPKAIGSIEDAMALIKKSGKIARLTGPDKDGKKDVDLPAWYTRTGIRSFEVDTGLGIVKCRVPKDTVEEDDKGDLREDQLIPLVIHALRAIPDFWKAEETLVFTMVEGKDAASSVLLTISEGQPLPSPDRFGSAPLATMRDYLHNLPKSLLTQVFLGIGYNSLAWLPVDPTPAV